MTATITYTGVLVVHTCWCGIEHAIPDGLDRHVRNTGASAYCPLGHSWVIKGRTTEQLLEDSKAESKRRWELLHDEREQHRHTERRLNATRGVVTRTRKRIAGGVCPCCNRTFVGLGRHMASQHPDYVEREIP